MYAKADRWQQIEELRQELHRRMNGGYDPTVLERLLPISRRLDHLVVAVTREAWSASQSQHLLSEAPSA